MVNVMDLRLGNKVYITPLGVNTVYEIGSLDFAQSICDNYNPIPLTPEILEKCGFKKEGEWGVLNFPPRMGIRFFNFNYAECDIVQDNIFIALKCSHIKYLHQLQNLYYALTNEELQIKL